MDTITRDKLIYVPENRFVFATNTFINVPVILAYEDTPLITMVNEVEAGFTAEFSIFNQDGVKLAVARGTQLFKTADGDKSNLDLNHEPGLTAAVLDGLTLFELRRDGPAALKGQAELFSPDGQFVRCDKSIELNVLIEPKPLQIGGVSMELCTIKNCRIGIRVAKDGRTSMGCR